MKSQGILKWILSGNPENMSGNKTRAGQRGTQILTDSAKIREKVVMKSKCNKWRISIGREID